MIIKHAHIRKVSSLCLMILLGGICIQVSDHYFTAKQAQKTIAMVTKTVPEDISELPAATPSNTLVKEERPTVYVPNLSRLNLAYIYPEEADTSNVRESYAGKAFEVLMNMDEEWYSNLFLYGDFLPETVAAQLGKDRSSVMGGYNPSDEYHQADNPETWAIHSFKRIHTSFVNGDGIPISGSSNVIPIMSMANVYMFYHDSTDYDSYVEYAKTLWNASHSHNIRLGDMYYCSGCIGEDAENAELEALREEARLEESGGSAADTDTSEESSQTRIVSYDSVSAEAYENPETAITIYTQKNDNPLDGPGTAILASPSDADTSDASAEGESRGALTDMSQETLHAVDDVLPETAAPEAQTSVAGVPSYNSLHRNCPGHVDLYITATVRGLEDTRGLFEADTTGNQTTVSEAESRWNGWNLMNRGYVSALSNQDWYEQYGLSVSMISLRTPLTVSEIEEYLQALPDSISEERRQLVEVALSSVGQIPYYWGGKPRTAGYSGNNFGAVTYPDEDGRILRGLDCSGWINWVYWSTFGKRLPYESTSGLATLGRRVNRSQLQPGDIVVRTGSQAHVIMFLGWTEDGQIQCIEETSGTVNNVRLSIREAYWPYYRNLID